MIKKREDEVTPSIKTSHTLLHKGKTKGLISRSLETYFFENFTIILKGEKGRVNDQKKMLKVAKTLTWELRDVRLPAKVTKIV